MVMKQQLLFRKLGKPCGIYKTRPSGESVSELALGSAKLPDQKEPAGYLVDESNVIFDTDNNKALIDAERPYFLPGNDPFKEYAGNLIVKIKENGAEYSVNTATDEATVKPPVWECTISKRSVRNVINGQG